MKTIAEPAKELPVVYEKDVVVVDGGPGGLVATIASEEDENAKGIKKRS